MVLPLLCSSSCGWYAAAADHRRWVVTLVTIYSGYDYLKKNWDLIKDGAVKAK